MTGTRSVILFAACLMLLAALVLERMTNLALIQDLGRIGTEPRRSLSLAAVVLGMVIPVAQTGLFSCVLFMTRERFRDSVRRPWDSTVGGKAAPTFSYRMYGLLIFESLVEVFSGSYFILGLLSYLSAVTAVSVGYAIFVIPALLRLLFLRRDHSAKTKSFLHRVFSSTLLPLVTLGLGMIAFCLIASLADKWPGWKVLLGALSVILVSATWWSNFVPFYKKDVGNVTGEQSATTRCDPEGRERSTPSATPLSHKKEWINSYKTGVQDHRRYKLAAVKSFLQVGLIIAIAPLLYWDTEFSGAHHKLWVGLRDIWGSVFIWIVLIQICSTIAGFYLFWLLVATGTRPVYTGTVVIASYIVSVGLARGWCDRSFPSIGAFKTWTCPSEEYYAITMMSVGLVLLLGLASLAFNEDDDLKPCVHLARESVLWHRPTTVAFLAAPSVLLNRQMKMSAVSRQLGQTTTQGSEGDDIYVCTTLYREERKELLGTIRTHMRLCRSHHENLTYHFIYVFDGAYENSGGLEAAELFRSILTDEGFVKTSDEEVGFGSVEVYRFKDSTTFTVLYKNTEKIRKRKRWSMVLYLFLLQELFVQRSMGEVKRPTVPGGKQVFTIKDPDFQEVLDTVLIKGQDLDQGPGNVLIRKFSPEKQEIYREWFEEIETNLHKHLKKSYLLTNDADVGFEPRAVKALFDSLNRDYDAAGACGRVAAVGEGPVALAQKFEYNMAHWLQKSAEDVFGSVMCCPGCFALFRLEALLGVVKRNSEGMGDVVKRSILQRYCRLARKPLDIHQYDQGEDRWLCQLLVQQGWRLKYTSSSALAETHCPESIERLFVQRRRWTASTLANIFRFLGKGTEIARRSECVTKVFVLYQLLLFVSGVVSPASLCLALASGLVSAFEWPLFWSILVASFPIVVFIIVCRYFKEATQLKLATFLSSAYVLLIGILCIGLMVNERSRFHRGAHWITIDLTVLLAFCAIITIATLTHWSKFDTLRETIGGGFVFFFLTPALYLFIPLFSVLNMDNKSWGTREQEQGHDSLSQRIGPSALWGNVVACFKTYFVTRPMRDNQNYCSHCGHTIRIRGEDRDQFCPQCGCAVAGEQDGYFCFHCGHALGIVGDNECGPFCSRCGRATNDRPRNQQLRVRSRAPRDGPQSQSDINAAFCNGLWLRLQTYRAYSNLVAEGDKVEQEDLIKLRNNWSGAVLIVNITWVAVCIIASVRKVSIGVSTSILGVVATSVLLVALLIQVWGLFVHRSASLLIYLSEHKGPECVTGLERAHNPTEGAVELTYNPTEVDVEQPRETTEHKVELTHKATKDKVERARKATTKSGTSEEPLLSAH